MNNITPVSSGDNPKGFSVVRQPDGSEAVMSEKGKYYQQKNAGQGKTVLSMSEVNRETSFKKCIKCKTDLLPKWDRCEACNTDQYKTRP